MSSGIDDKRVLLDVVVDVVDSYLEDNLTDLPCYPPEIILKLASGRINGGRAEELIEARLRLQIVQEGEFARRVDGSDKVPIELGLHQRSWKHLQRVPEYRGLALEECTRDGGKSPLPRRGQQSGEA